MKSLFRVQEFGQTNSKVIFFFAGMGTRTWLYRSSIKRMVSSGFRVIAYDFDAMLVRNGDADAWLEVGQKTKEDVNRRLQEYQAAGVHDFCAFGVSMSTLMAIKCTAEIAEISKVIVNLTYGSVAENIWTWWFVKPAKQKAIMQGYSLQELDKKLVPISPIPNAAKLKGKKVLLYLSHKDKIILYKQSSQFKDALDRAGVDYRFIENKRRGHIVSGYKNFKKHEVWLDFLNT